MQPSNRRTWQILGALVGVALLLDFIFYPGYVGSDDIEYMGGGRLLFTDYYEDPTLGNVRLGAAIPCGIVWVLTGGSVAAVAWMHCLYHVALVLLAYALGKQVHDRTTGLVAAGVVATAPIYYRFAGAALPDNPGTCWLALMLILLVIVKKREVSSGGLDLRSSFRWYFSIGLVLGVAYTCKESALIMTIPAAACVIAASPRLLDLRWMRNGIFMAAGLVVVIGVEMFVLWLAHDEWYSRILEVSRHEDSTGEYLKTMAEQGGSNPLDRLWFAWKYELRARMPLTAYLYVASAVAYAFVRPRGSLAVFLFFWWPALFLTIGSTNFSAYRPAPIQVRYYAQVFVPAAVMLAAVLVYLVRRWQAWQRPPAWARGRALIAALIVAAGVVVVREVDRNLPDSGNMYWSVRARSYSDAYSLARQRYPQYPIMFGPLYRERMNYLMFDVPEEVFDERDRLDGHWPTPPYLYIELGGRVPSTDSPHMGTAAIETLEVLTPAGNRWEILKDMGRRLFTVPPYPAMPPTTKAHAVIMIVRDRYAPRPPDRAGVVHWVELRPEIATTVQAYGGDVVYWEGDDDFFVQLFDRARRIGEAPGIYQAQLAEGTRRLRLRFEVRQLRGRHATVSFTLHGYPHGGGQALTRQLAVDLQALAQPTWVELELLSPTPLIAYRVRASVQPGTGHPGGLYLGTPAVYATPY